MNRNHDKRKINSQSKSPQEGEFFVKVKTVARALGVTAAHVRVLFIAGELPGQRIGSRWYMHRADFEKLTRLSSSREQTAA